MSKIEWTEASWNPVVGCSVVSLDIFRGPNGVDADGKTPGWAGAFWYLTDLGKQVARSMIPTYGGDA